MADRYCRNCGHQLAEGDRFCPNCGTPVHQAVHVPTPEADILVPPQQAGQVAMASGRTEKERKSKIYAWLALGVVLLHITIIIIGALGGGGSGQQAANSTPERAEKDKGVEGGGKDLEAKEPEEGEEANPQKEGQQANQSQEGVYSIGDEVKVGDVSYKVTDAEKVTQLMDPFGVDPPMQGNFIVVTFIFTDNGTKAATVSDIGMYLYDSQGRQFETDTDAAYYLPQDKSLYLLDRVNPGLSQEVQTVYWGPSASQRPSPAPPFRDPPVFCFFRLHPFGPYQQRSLGFLSRLW
jgi:hypothetical protein